MIPSPWHFPVQRLRITNTLSYAREVCLKHRKNRREMIPAGASFDFVSNGGSGVCSFCRIYAARVAVRNDECKMTNDENLLSTGEMLVIRNSTFVIPYGARAAHSAPSLDWADFHTLFAAIVQQQDP